MSFVKRFIYLVPALLLVFTPGCSDDDTVKPPPPPPQIPVLAKYSKNIDPTKGLQSNDVYDIMVDSNGKTWFATSSGVSRFNGTTSEAVYNQNNALPNPKCRTIAQCGDRIYVGTWGGGVGVYNMTGNLWSKLNTDSGLVNNLVADIDVYDNKVYFATNGGISVYEHNTGLPVRQRWDRYTGDNILGNFVSSVEVDSTPRGTEEWFGPAGDDVAVGQEHRRGITVIRETSWLPIHYTITNSDLPEPRINDIFYDADLDEFWVATKQKGLAKVDVSGSSWTIYTTGDGLPADLVYCITKVNGVIWVGTQNGVARQLSDGTFRGYGRSAGLPGDRVRVVYTDAQNRLWLGFVQTGAALVNHAAAE